MLYPMADHSASKLQALFNKADALNSALTSEMIAAGRGHERPSETRELSDQLSCRFNANTAELSYIREEMNRRKTWGGTLKPIPIAHRQSFYAR